MRKEKCCFVFAADRGWYSGVVIRGERERKSALFSQIKSFVTGFQRIDQSFFAHPPTLAELFTMLLNINILLQLHHFLKFKGSWLILVTVCQTLS